ncbi:MAG: hypothetical protein NNA30_02320 [Nitrospira sp.]|nr:hypothetical protein [Nitrospira sp.]
MAGEMKVEDLLGELGQAIHTAQMRLNKQSQERPPGSAGLPTTLSISETDLEVKILFEEKQGSALVRPVGRASADTPSAAFSTLRAKIVAVADEDVRPPQRTPSDVREEIIKRPDIARLAKIFGDLQVTTTFVPEAARWLVDVVEPSGSVLRRIQVEDGKSQ